MRWRWVNGWAFWGLSLLVACKPQLTAPLPAPVPVSEASSVSGGSVVGNWSQIDPYHPDVQEAARFAVQTFAVQNKTRVLFKEVTLARQQVVAGRQWELNLDVVRDGTRHKVTATVWHQANGRYSLTDWVWQD